jgi:localization factor PodJL
MARATSTFQTQDYGQPASGEWQDLRGELVALLDQVETQVARTARPEPSYEGLAERMRDLRHQVTEAEPDTRHREALRSVQRAIDKFSDRDEVEPQTNPRDTLESAIQQIRSRHFGGAPAMAAPAPLPQMPAPQTAPRFDELAEAVGGISSRLERLEGELRVQAKGQTANVREIADQVSQLSHVVELLAGAVGETGQVKRLEGHIAGLAKLIAEGPRVDMAALNQRLDDVALTVGKLAELQKHYADRSDMSGMTARLDDVSATVGRLADLQVQFANRVEGPKGGLADAMTAIEDGVRNIYDRVDAIEKAMAMPPAELERITEELGAVAQAMRSPQPQGLIELIDALNVRISDIEGRSAEVGGLKLDMEALRNTVVGALEPRFVALEQQIEVLSDKVSERPADLSVAQLEAQVRQLVARMDQTGEQLTGLAKLYTGPAGQDAPDFEQLAELVATRTSDAVKRADTATKTGLDEAGYAEIEKRLSKVMLAAAKEKPSEDNAALDATIREVNERLKRLESSLAQGAEAAPAVSLAALPELPPAKPAAVEPMSLVAQPLDDDRLARPQPAEAGDSMPSDPIADAPLMDKPFGDPNPLRTALEAKNGPRKRQPEAVVEPPPAPIPSLDLTDEPAKPPFDPGLAERPPQPRSSLDAPAEVVYAAPVVAALADEPPMPSRNTFIEAHRRAARQAAATRVDPAAAASGSLIGKAFARFQASRNEAAAEAPTVSTPMKPVLDKAARPAKAKQVEPAEAAPAKPSLFSRFKAKATRQLAGDKDPVKQWTPDEPAGRVLPVAPEPSFVALGAEDSSPAADDAAGKPQSFLLRHKQPILLAASVVALAFLTINLINQRMKPTDADAPAPTAQNIGDASMTPVPLSQQGFEAQPASGVTPRVIPTLDKLTTASIGGATPQKFVASAEAPKMPQAFEAATAVAAVDPTTVASLGADLSADVTPLDAMESPVRVQRPPAEIGPEPLLAAAADGDARAQFEVAAIYTEGRAVPEDLEAAAMWYERAAGQGFAPAQYRLGNLYENGRGVAKDLAQARLWYQRAAEAGNRMAMHNLAALYAGGGLGAQQFDAAAKWFEEAANRGMKDSQFNLGMLHARGLGVKQDLAASFKWFSLAANRGDKDAAKSRDDIAASLDAATVQKVIAEVAAFKPEPIDFVANFAPIGTWSPSFDPGAPISNIKVVAGVQLALTLLGFDIGTPDGVAGPKTAEAIKSFERATGMSESGTINPRLLAVLGSQPV